MFKDQLHLLKLNFAKDVVDHSTSNFLDRSNFSSKFDLSSEFFQVDDMFKNFIKNL